MDFQNTLRAAFDASAGVRLILAASTFDGSRFIVEAFSSFDDLAARCARLRRSGALKNAHIRAFARDGSQLPLADALARGERILANLSSRSRLYFWLSPMTDYVRRAGPVAGTACRRGGGGCCRHIATLNEKKSAQDLGDGAPAPRGARSLRMIPDAWDDYMRGNSRSWKKQTRGHKAWDRRGRAPSGDRKAMASQLLRVEQDDIPTDPI